mmetsp:Transcript_106784/g.344550  ORF Transcript_106784/g.344550 Transcript_106784/m.344550 type:complete len:386 (-) Transcript_106784:119-1276(-)
MRMAFMPPRSFLRRPHWAPTPRPSATRRCHLWSTPRRRTPRGRRPRRCRCSSRTSRSSTVCRSRCPGSRPDRSCSSRCAGRASEVASRDISRTAPAPCTRSTSRATRRFMSRSRRQKNEIATVQCLLEYGANINVVNFLGAAPLHYVCLRKSNYRGIANILLENGAVIDCQTLAGKTPLHFACEQQQTELVEVLCHFGADVNIPDVEGNMAIHLNLAKPAGRDTVKRQIIEQLLSCQASFQAPNLEGQMPIHLACRGGYIRCVQLLVEQRADVSSLTSRGETGLHLAVQHNHAEVTQLLLQYHPSTMDLADINGNTPLHICAMHGGLDCAVLLLRMGTDTNARNGQGKSAFDLAKIRGTDLSNTHNAELEQILKDAQKGGGCRQS